jgi:hypothetical protein
MISPKFYSQIQVCPVCRGWGTREKSTAKVGEECRECGGSGVSVKQSGSIFIWDAPSFVNFRARSMVLYFKIGSIVFVLFMFFLFMLMIGSLFSSIR